MPSVFSLLGFNTLAVIAVATIAISYYFINREKEQKKSYHESESPSIRYDTRPGQSRDITDEDVCSICLCTFLIGITIKLNCKHRYHKECIQEHVRKGAPPMNSCPMCRRLIDPKGRERIFR